jgi:hypothetical protein
MGKSEAPNHSMEAHAFSGPLMESNNKLWGYHVMVPELIANAFMANDAKRVVCTLQGDAATFQCGLIPKGEGRYCIMINKKLRDQLRLKAESIVHVSIVPDDDPYGLPMTEELQAVLETDPEGNELFHALTPGKIRTLLYQASYLKSTEARIARALAIVEHLKKNNGKIDYKQLGEDFKNALSR